MISSEDVKLVGEWADKIFNQAPGGFSDERVLLHIVEEIGELCRVPGDVIEMADIILCIMHLAHRKGVDLGKAMVEKHKLCMEAEWHYAEDSGRMRRVKNS